MFPCPWTCKLSNIMLQEQQSQWIFQKQMGMLIAACCVFLVLVKTVTWNVYKYHLHQKAVVRGTDLPAQIQMEWVICSLLLQDLHHKRFDPYSSCFWENNFKVGHNRVFLFSVSSHLSSSKGFCNPFASLDSFCFILFLAEEGIRPQRIHSKMQEWSLCFDDHTVQQHAGMLQVPAQNLSAL